MATRYYTEEAFEQIRRTIEQIDNTDVNRVMDFFSDMFQRLAHFLEFYSVDNYKDDMQKWYDKVLDTHNSTISEIDKIFNAVDTVDFEYRDKIMDGAVQSIINFRGALNCLRDVISGKSSLTDGKAAADGYVATGTSLLNASCDTILTKIQQKTLWDASKALVGDAIKLGSGYIKCLCGGNFTDYKKLGETILATACDLLSIVVIVAAPIAAVGDALDGKMDMRYEDYIDAQFMLLSPAQKLKNVNSISDLLDNLAEDMTEQLEQCSPNSPMYPIIEILTDLSQKTADNYKLIDIAIDAYGIGSDLKDIHDTLDEWGDGKVSHAEIIKKAVSNWFGVPISGWNDPSKFDGNIYKAIGTIWSYTEKIIPDINGAPNIVEHAEVFWNKVKDTKFLKDVFDFAKNIGEYSSNLGSAGSQSGSGGVKGGRYGWSIRQTGVN